MSTFNINTPEDDTEAKLLDQYIDGISNGDKASLGTLYEKTSSAIYGFALSIVKNPARRRK